MREAWRNVDPRPFVDSWHIGAICEHLEAVSRGEIRKLVINIPPRTTKSLTTSVLWPAWEWTFNPACQWLHASYALGLSLRDSTRCRRLVESPWYRERFPGVVLRSDQDQKGRWELTTGGYRISTSVGGSTTGDGGDRLVIDDPHNVNEADSELKRQGTIDWYDQTWSTRLNDAETGCMAIIMQRVHQADLTGHVLETEPGEWQHLLLPARYEPERRCVTVWTKPDGTLERHEPDTRTNDGELLCPERMGEDVLVRLERTLGTYGAAGQLQQSPSPRAGGLFEREWWGRYNTTLLKRQGLKAEIIVVDAANKDGVANDYTAISVWSRLRGLIYVLACLNERLAYPELRQAVRDVHAKYRCPILVEDKGNGIALIDDLGARHRTRHHDVYPALPIIPYDPGRASKAARATTVTGDVQAGLVHLPFDEPWVEDWIEQHAQFPNGRFDDMVDNTSIALDWYRNMGDDAESDPVGILYAQPLQVRR